jgi:pimeloyl-ACP methyl ester carboxylesterase
VVLIHGAVISGRYMLPTAELLAPHRPVFVPDLPGFGRSEDPPAPLSVPELASALRAILDAAGIARAHVLGNSLGAQVAADFAARFPERTASAILVGPTVDAASRTRFGTLWRLAKDAIRERPSLIPLHLIDIVRAGPRFAIASLDVALADHVEDKLPRVSAPVLIVTGHRDPLVPRDWAAWLAARTPCARFEVIEGPHALNYSRPRELTRLVLDFLAQVERAED